MARRGVVVLGLLAICLALLSLSEARISASAAFGGQERTVLAGSDISISAVSVLLPQSRSVRYKLEAFNGCFRWYEMRCSMEVGAGVLGEKLIRVGTNVSHVFEMVV